MPLIGLALHYSPWGIRLYPSLVSLLLFIGAMAATAWHRRRRLLPGERFEVNFSTGLSRLALVWRGQGRWDRVLTLLLAAAIAATLGTLVYMVQTPKVGERFTEFYILGPEGKAEDYPRDVILGENSKVMVGIANQEKEATVYRVEVSIDGEEVNEAGPIVLEHKAKREQEVIFAPIRAGPSQKVDFRLYRVGGSEVYRTRHLWVAVRTP